MQGHIDSVVSATHELARAVMLEHDERVNAAIIAAVEAGADHVDLPRPGGAVERVDLAMDVEIDGRIERRRVVGVQLIDMADGSRIPALLDPDLRDGEMAVHFIDGTVLICRGAR
jgi:hypothetical protein